MLEIKDLIVSYNKQEVLKELSLNIENGTILGLLGKNGTGKTTLFESIYQSTKYQGEIKWHNQKIKRKDQNQKKYTGLLADGVKSSRSLSRVMLVILTRWK